MPSFTRHRSISPSDVIDLAPASPVKSVGFAPITSAPRTLTNDKLWRLYNFEAHARLCSECIDPYHVHKYHGRLCDQGHLLAQDVARIMYSKHRGRETFDATVPSGHELVRVDLPTEYSEVRSLLKAMERSLRHRKQRPIVSFDRSYPVALRTGGVSRHQSTREPSGVRAAADPDRESPRRSLSLNRASDTSSPRRQERRQSQVVDWPQTHDVRAPPSSWKAATSTPQAAPAYQAVAVAAPLLRTHYVQPTATTNASTRAQAGSPPRSPSKTPHPQPVSSTNYASSTRAQAGSPPRTPESRPKSSRSAKAEESSRPSYLVEGQTHHARSTLEDLRMPLNLSSTGPTRLSAEKAAKRASMYAAPPVREYTTELREPKTSQKSKTRRYSGF